MTDLLTQARNSYKEEYNELSAIWNKLENKAQAVTAVSGIFLAGTLAFVDQISALAALRWTIFLVVFSLLALTASVIYSLLAIWIRSIKAPPLGTQIIDIIRDLIDVGGEQDTERISNYLNDEISLWDSCNSDLSKANEKKSYFVQYSQVLLLLAIVVMTFNIILVTINP